MHAPTAQCKAIEAREVLLDGLVHADAVTTVYAVDLCRGLSARLPRFRKDSWMEIVHPARLSEYLEMLHHEFERDGAKWVAAPADAEGNILELPAQLHVRATICSPTARRSWPLTRNRLCLVIGLKPTLGQATTSCVVPRRGRSRAFRWRKHGCDTRRQRV